MTDDTCPLTHHNAAPPNLPHGRTVCPTCTGALRSLLTDLPGLMTDIETTLTKRARFTLEHGRATTPVTDDDAPYAQTAATTALPFAYAASEAGYVARQTVLVWLDWITAVRAHRVPETWDEVGDYLANRALHWVAGHPDGPQVVDELTAALRQARRAIDRPAERRYAGTCEMPAFDGTGWTLGVACGEALYALACRATITCPRCGAEHDVRARQDTMLNQLRDHVLNAADMARAVDGLGVDINADRIRQWKRRHLLTQAVDEHGAPRNDPRGRPLYRVGDVLDIVAGRVRLDAAG